MSFLENYQEREQQQHVPPVGLRGLKGKHPSRKMTWETHAFMKLTLSNQMKSHQQAIANVMPFPCEPMHVGPLDRAKICHGFEPLCR